MSDATIVDYTWLVSDFSDLPNELISSSKFRVGSNTFCLELYPSGKPPQRDVVSVFLRREEDFGVKVIGVKFRISIMCNKEYYKSRTTVNAFRCLDSCGFPKLIGRCELADEKCSLLPGNILTIQCDILLEETGSYAAALKERMAETLSLDLSCVLKSGEYSDMVIIAEGKKFNVHKVILKSRCPHLIKFLQKTKRPNEYIILNIKASDFHEILYYLYTGRSNIKNVNKEMLDALKKFHVSHLSHSLFLSGKKILARSDLVTSEMSFRWLIQDFSELRDGKEVTFPAYYYTESDWSKMEIVFMAHKEVSTSKYVYFKFKKLEQNQDFYMTCRINQCLDTDVSISQEDKVHFKHNESIVKFQFEDKHLLNNLELDFELKMSKVVTTQSKEIINVNTKNGDWFANYKQLQSDLDHLYSTTCCVILPDCKGEDYENRKSRRHEDCDSGDEAVSKNVKSREYEIAENDGDEHENRSDGSVKEAGDSDLNWDDSDVNCKDTITLYVGENAIPAHKVLLGSRLKDTSDLEVSDEKWVLNIEGLSTSTLSFLLRYIYSGCVSDLDVEEALNLYAAARKCKLSFLEEWCMHFLLESLDSLHIGEILLFADEHKDPHLKMQVFNYISDNPEVARKSESLADALKSKADLLQEAYEDILMTISKG